MAENTAKDDRKSIKTKEEIQSWLINQIAGLMYIEPSTLDIQASFNSFGLSSRDAVMLSGDLEEWLGRRLSPTLLYEYPTISSLSEFLSKDEKSGLTQSASSISAQPDELNTSQIDRIEDLEQLSEDDAEIMLLDQLKKLNS